MIADERDPRELGRVAVLMGGWSAERQVSLWSGQAVLEALCSRGVNAEGVDVSRARLLALPGEGFDLAFIALHGPGGEDGVVQGLLEIAGLPYTGSGVLASALAMDKLRTKLVWAAAGIPTPPYRMMYSAAEAPSVVAELGLPLFVKPATEGSTIGVTKVTEAEALVHAFDLARQYGPAVLVERFIVGPEYTASILGRETLPLIRIDVPTGLYDFKAKYQSDATRYQCPCDLPVEREAALRELALRAFDVLDARGWGRIDLMLDERGQPWLLELNTVPGMTSHSLVPMAAKARGLSFDELVWRILMMAYKNTEIGEYGDAS